MINRKEIYILCAILLLTTLTMGFFSFFRTPSFLKSRDYVVFDESYAKNLGGFFGNLKLFTPSPSDIETTEKLFLEKQPNLTNYYRQYFGVINEKGEKEIRLIALRKAMGRDFPKWRNEIVIVDDGGTAFYDGVVNLNTNTVLYLRPHGEA